MILQDFHMHTSFCDGKNTPEEMVLAAINMGVKKLGFSAHSFTYFDSSYSLSLESTEEYIAEVQRLKELYKDKIEIYCGIEHDFYSAASTNGFDYIIGSVHYVKVREKYIPVDMDPDELVKNVNMYFDGDFYAFAEEYFKNVESVIDVTNGDIIGHFDLITKFNEKYDLFDTSHPRYIAAWKRAADVLLTKNRVFEINTGAISRGYRTLPYPAFDMIEYIKSHGGRFILSSDSHSADSICYKFEEFKYLL